MTDDRRICGCNRIGRHRRACKGPIESYRAHRDKYPIVSVYVGPKLIGALVQEAVRRGVPPSKVLLEAWLSRSLSTKSC